MKQNSKQHQKHNPKFEVIPIKAEINIPTAEDFVTIPVWEFEELVACKVTLEVVKRLVEQDSKSRTYIDNTTMRSVLAMPLAKEENT